MTEPFFSKITPPSLKLVKTAKNWLPTSKLKPFFKGYPIHISYLRNGMTDWAEILRANLWMKKNKIEPKKFQKNPYLEIRISGSRKLSAWGSQFFFEWIFFMKKILFMKKNPENIFPDFFAIFGRFYDQNFKNLHFWHFWGC